MLQSSPGCSTYSRLAQLALEPSDIVTGCLQLHDPPQVGDLMPALKARFQDANRNLGAQTLLLLASLAKAMGRPIAREARPILGPGVKCICDSKPQVRLRWILHQAQQQCASFTAHNCLYACTLSWQPSTHSWSCYHIRTSVLCGLHADC